MDKEQSEARIANLKILLRFRWKCFDVVHTEFCSTVSAFGIEYFCKKAIITAKTTATKDLNYISKMYR